MNRLLYGLVLLAVSLAGVSCGGDPTSDLRGGPVQVVADPSSVFLTTGGSTHIIARVLDEQGNELDDTVTFSTTSSAVSVAYDPNYLVGTDTTNPGGTVPSKTRTAIVVTGVNVDLGDITLSSGDVSTTIPFRVLPGNLDSTFTAVAQVSNRTPASGEVVTLTAPGFKFQSGALVTFATGGTAVPAGVSADSNTLSFIPIPGSSGLITVDSTALAIVPTVPLTAILPDTTLTVPPALAGVDSLTTAPTIAVPAIGASTSLFDAGVFAGADNTGDGGVGAQYYKFVVTQAGDYTFTLDWPNDADLDPVVCFDVDCADGAFAGTGVDQPEQGTLTLDPGTYYFAVVLFAAGSDGAGPNYFTLKIDAAPPSP